MMFNVSCHLNPFITYLFQRNVPLVTKFPTQSCINSHIFAQQYASIYRRLYFIMKSLLEKDIFNEMIVAHENLSYDTKINRVAHKMIGFSLKKN